MPKGIASIVKLRPSLGGALGLTEYDPLLGVTVLGHDNTGYRRNGLCMGPAPMDQISKSMVVCATYT